MKIGDPARLKSSRRTKKSHVCSTDLTIGEFLPWDNSTENEKKNLGTLIYANRH
jgi:hypothetical protein